MYSLTLLFYAASGGEYNPKGLKTVLPHLNEKQRRLFLAAEAKALGRGGISRVARATGVSRVTIYKALKEIKYHPFVSERVRKPGGLLFPGADEGAQGRDGSGAGRAGRAHKQGGERGVRARQGAGCRENTGA